MNLASFVASYDINELNFVKIVTKDNSIYAYISMNLNIELIANGYRPGFDIHPCHLFVFENQNQEYNYAGEGVVKSYLYDGKSLSIKLEDYEFKVTDCNIKIHSNVTIDEHFA